MDATITAALEEKQYIIVRVGKEQFGIDIKHIDNIVRIQRITRVPKVQPYFKGVINLRGEIVPVMSLRRKFMLEEIEYTNASRIIILKPEGKEVIGIIVDEVKEVLSLQGSQIDKVTYAPSNENYKYLSGIGKYENNLISILNISAIISERDIV